LKENIILYLETGGGKTLIAVLLMKSLAHNLRLKGDKRIAVFLVPTVILVHQQADVIGIHTDLKVGRYWGNKGVDTWSINEWQKEIESNEVVNSLKA
jgi:endoribonuclease Dicer